MGHLSSKQHQLVTKVRSLSEIYDTATTTTVSSSSSDSRRTESEIVEKEKERYERLIKEFMRQFENEEPDVIARSPGRVNLIGEHIDYEGYSVLPMAIGLDVVVAVKVCTKNPTTTEKEEEKEEERAMLSIANVEGDKYTKKEFVFDHEQVVDVQSHHWTNYVLCAFKGIFDQMRLKGVLEKFLASEFVKNIKKVCVIVDGRVPLGSGLSSSSALNCAVTVALMEAFKLSFTKGELADLTCLSERYSGTQSGGMDQAISIMGEKNLAKRIDFNPIGCHDVPLPKSISFLIGNSCAVSKKAESAYKHYNLRVVECRLAAILMAKYYGEGIESAKKKMTLREVADLYCNKGDLWTALGATRKALNEGSYTRKQLENDEGLGDLQQIFGTENEAFNIVLKKNDSFKLRDRARHVFSEARRVREFQKICEGQSPHHVLFGPIYENFCKAIQLEPDVGVASDDPTKDFGHPMFGLEKEVALAKLMELSHTSCKEQFECSCDELDELVEAFNDAGALGARLTGAGWGGCVVAAVESDKADKILADVKEKFYEKRFLSGLANKSDEDSLLFRTVPSAGAAILVYDKAKGIL